MGAHLLVALLLLIAVLAAAASWTSACGKVASRLSTRGF